MSLVRPFIADALETVGRKLRPLLRTSGRAVPQQVFTADTKQISPQVQNMLTARVPMARRGPPVTSRLPRAATSSRTPGA